MQRRVFLTFLLLVCALRYGVAQIGPAGVGNAGGINDQPENLIWLDASDLSSFSEGSVWFDKSGNENNATHINMGGNAPSLSLSALNGQNILDFDGSASYLRILDDGTGDNRLDGMDELAIFAVFNPGSNDTRALISKRQDYSAGNRSWSLYHDSGYTLKGYAGSGNAGGGVNTSGGFGIASYILNNSLSLYYNGDLQNSNGSGYSIPDRSENICIGRFDERTSETRWSNGSLAEILVFRDGINTAQRTIIENYLSEKYSIALSTSANDKFTPSDASFIKDIAGVGLESDGVHSLASSAGFYVALRDSSVGDYIMTGHDGTINNVVTSVSVADAAWNRAWYVESTGTPTVRMSFDLSEGIRGQYPQDITNYVLLRKDSPSGSYAIVPTSVKGIEESDRIYFEIEDADFSNGYYTLGSLDQTVSPLEGGSRRIWYALRSTADWDSPDAWTLEPCGCLPNNPDGYTPVTSPTAASDKVVILSGKKITVPVGINNLANGELVIEGELDLQTTKGHSFSTISGTGIIKMATDNFPTGDASDFITEGEGEGKVQFYGSGYTIKNTHEFYDVEIDLNSSTSEIVLTSDLIVNGDLELNRGILKINDDSSSDDLNIDVNGDLSVSSNSQLLTGVGSARHQLNLYGDFKNQGGVVKFTNRTTAIYNSDATDGIVDVNFLNNTTDQLITCNGITNFYRIEVDKGDDDTYILSINASETDNFKLFGRANYSHSSVAQLTTNNNALGLLTGTVRLGQNVVIDQLNTSGNYNVSEAACLWVDGGSVTMSSGNSLVPYGTVKVSSGTLSVLVPSGITLRDNGNIQIEDGIINTNQIRTSILGAEHQGGYMQSGGTVNIVGGSSTTDYYLFNLTYEGNTFQMSGGTLNMQQANSKGGIFINSLESNYNVTGGTIIANISNSNDFVITSRAPFYNLILEKSISNSNVFVLDNGVDVGSTDVYLEAQPLKVLNDFRIRGEESATDYPDITFKAVNSNDEPVDLYIGGSMFIENGADYIFAVGGTSPYDGNSNQPTSANTIYFNQTIGTSSIDTLYWGHDGAGNNKIEAEERLELGNFVLDRNSGNELRTIAASNIKNNQIFVDVNGDASVLSGTLDQGRQVFRTWGKIVNYDRMGTWYEDGSYPVSGGTPKYAQIRFREDTDLKIITKEGAVFGNIRFNVNPNTKKTPIILTSDVKIERMEFMRGAIYLKGYNLTVDRMWNLQGNGESFTDIANSDELNVTNTGVNGKKLIYTDGKASDGGLTLYIYQDTEEETEDTRNENLSPVTFPVGYTTDGGTTIYHRPAQMKVKDFSDDGYVTIRPVSGTLQTTDPTGNKEILPMYWRVTHGGFDILPTVAFQFYYCGEDVSVANLEDEYVPGYVLNELPFTRGYENGVSDIINAEVVGATRRIVFNGSSTGGEFDNDAFEGFTLMNANYTCGESQRFNGTPQVYYNKRQNNAYWNDKNSWYEDPEGSKDATDYPQAGDIAVIRGSSWTHNITVNGSQQCAQIIFEREGTYSDIESLPRLRVGPNDVITAGVITGVGDLYLQRNLTSSANVFGDIGDFASNDTSVVQFYTMQNGTYSVDEDDFLNDLPTLRVYGAGSYNRNIIFNYDLKCKNLVVDGHATLVVGGDYEVENQIRLGFTSDGNIQFPNGTEPFSLTTNDLYTSTGKGSEAESYTIDVASGGTNAVEHYFIVKGNINFNYRGDVNLSDYLLMDLYNSSIENNVILSLEGNNSGELNNMFGEGQYSLDLYKIQVGKGSNADSTFTINTNFSLDAPSDGDVKNIDLQNGLLVLNNDQINIDLSTGGALFPIAGTAGLEIKQGTVNVNGGSGILLDGILKISGGTLDMTDSDSGEGDNPIVYSTSGNSIIEVIDGTLLVGSQIRRAENDDLGVLKYTQTGGDVEIGISSGGISSRGMLEILNTGSSFTYIGGTLDLIQQNTSSPEIASLVLNPSSYKLTGSTINIFNEDTPTGQDDFGINSSIPLNNLTIKGINNPVANIKIRDLIIDGDLTIESGATIDAKGFAIEMEGDWINNGTYTASSGEVLFVGDNAQTITGNTTFYKLTKQDGVDVLSLGNSTEVTVDYLLTLSDGSIDDNGNNIYVKRDIVNNGEIINGEGYGIVLNGESNQRIYGDGTYEKLYLDNSNGFTQEEGNVITIKENLQMESGIMDIGKNLMVFEENATINTTTGFSESNLIQTDISFVDAGIKKYVPTGSLTFTYPLGSGGAYTPVSLNITNNSASGAYLRVKGANECHPSVVDLATTTMNETTNVLQYYWVLDANGFNDFQGTVSMSYPNSMVMVTESGYTYDDYITARLLDRGTGEWNKDVGTVDTSNDILYFDFSVATDDEGIKGDYTAGLDEAIPDQVPTYTSVKDGDWNDISVWSPTPPTGGPRGSIVVVDHNVTIPVDYISSYKTTVNDQITISETEGHRLGNVDGSGTIYLETGGMPAADYSEFFSSEGGTVEFSGTDKSYPVLSGIPTVNNIKFSGTGQRNLPNTDLDILGDLTIETSGSLFVNNVNDKDLTLYGNLNFDSGNIDWGQGSLLLNGTSLQNISGLGSLTGNNELYCLNVNNGNGVTLELNMEVSNTLKLTNGIINTENGGLVITNSETDAFEGGNSSSYVEGPLAKYINYNESFNFHVGKGDRYGSLKVFNAKGSSVGVGLWEVEYYNANPSDNEMDVNSLSGDVKFVSHNEYWRVQGPSTGSTAKLTLRWDDASGVDPDNNFRIVKWTDLDTDAWEELSVTNKGASASSGTADLYNKLTFGFSESDTNHYLTFGSIYIPAYTWLGNTSDWFDVNNWGGGVVPSAASDITIDTNGEAPVINVGSIAQVNNLIINHTGGLTLQPGARLTVNGDLSTNDLLTVNSTSELPATIIVDGNVTGEAEVKWLSLDNSRFWYMGHPVSGNLISDYNKSLNFEDDIKGYRIYVYNNTGLAWNKVKSASYDFSAMEAVALKVSSEKDLAYNGVFNNEADYSFNAQTEGYQTVANPYPSYIDLRSMYDNGEIEGFLPTVYIYASKLGVVTYDAYNAATGDYVNNGSQYISPCQSFWIHTDGDYTTNVLSVAKSDCVHTSTGSLKSTSVNENKIRLCLKNSNTNDETLISFQEYGQTYFTVYDSEKRMVTGKSGNLYTVKDNNYAAINSLPTIQGEEIIPLGYKVAQSGMTDFTIQVNDLSAFEPSVSVYLDDLEKGVSVDLRDERTYTFTPTVAQTDSRFQIRVVPSVTTDIDDEEAVVSNRNVSIYSVKQLATVKVSDEVLQNKDKMIEVYDISGQLVKQVEFNDVETTFTLPQTNTVYIINVKAGGASYQQKVVAEN